MIVWFQIRDSVMQDMPYAHKHLACDGDLHFQPVLASFDTLPV